MKAYYLSIDGDDDAGAAIVFAETPSKAKAQIYSTTLGDMWDGEWIYLRARREKRYDGLEKLSKAELFCKQWRDGWRWFDIDYPNEEEATDAEFIEWYNDVFPPRKKIYDWER